MRRDVKAEKAFAEDYLQEFDRRPTPAEINVAIYGEQMPSFDYTRKEKVILRLRYYTNLVRPDVVKMTKYAAAAAAGAAIYDGLKHLI